MDKEILEDIGLTGGEIKVFIALLEVGASTAGRIVEKSNLQNAVVHRALHSLAEKGLVTFVLEGKIRKYQAIEPRLLLKYLDEKRAKLEKIIPELEAKQKSEQDKLSAKIFQGTRGIREMLYLITEKGQKEYLAFGGAVRGDIIMGNHFWEQFHRTRVKNKLKARLLFHNSLSWWAKDLNKYSLTEVKLTKQDFDSNTETEICGDKVGISVFTEKPFGVLIEDKTVADSYRNFFEILWKQAKK